MRRRQGDQRNRRIVKPQVDRHRVVIAGSTVEQVNVVTKVLLKADAGVEMMKPRQPGFSGHVIATRHALLLHVRTLAPAGQRLIVIGRQTQILAPRLRTQPGTLQVFIKQVIVKGVVAEQPFSGNPALTDAGIAHQAVTLLRQPQLAPAQVTVVIIPGDKPAPAAAVKVPLVIHQ